MASEKSTLLSSEKPSTNGGSQGSTAPAVQFTKSTGLTSERAAELLAVYGRNELPEKHTPKWQIFLSQLIEPMPIMIWLAAAVELGIENYVDFWILMGIQFMNASLSYYETTKAGDAVAALKASLKPLAHVKRDGKFKTIEAGLLVPGDLVLLGSGGAAPADCFVNEGTIDVDQAALTGESLPVTMREGDEPKMGSTVVRGEVEGTVAYTGKDSFFGKTAAMLAGDDETSNLQKLLIKIMAILVVLSISLCVICFTYLLHKGEEIRMALSFTVVLLVASIPVAIEIVCTTTLALGSHQLSEEGAIVSRLAAIEDLAGMTILCSDKTGTLTLGKMVIQDETPVYAKGETQHSLLRYAAMAAKWKEPPRDALDTLVLNAVDMPSMSNVKQTDYMPFDPVVKRTEGTVSEGGGKSFKTTKGAPHVILSLCSDKSIAEKVDADVHAFGLRGIRAMAVAKNEGGKGWKMMGLLTFLDPPRMDTKATIAQAVEYGVDVRMVTGDHLLIAKETAKQLNMGTNIQGPDGLPMLEADGSTPSDLKSYSDLIAPADGFAQVYPEHKYLIVECLRQLGHKTGMTGDGVNDAPALKRADVGIAVQGATDAARAAADIVLTQPGLNTIVHAIYISRVIFQRMKNFLTYRIAATLQLLIFFFIAVICIHPHDYYDSKVMTKAGVDMFPPFFHMPVLMLMLITLLNDGTLISIGYDTVNASQQPQRWNLPVLFTIAAALGFVACASSLLILHAGLDSWNPDGLFHKFGLTTGLHYGQITTMMYLKVSISDFLTLFSARTLEGPFWSSKPSPILFVGACCALTVSTLLACVWPAQFPDGIETIGMAWTKPRDLAVYVWAYCLVCWLIQDAFKIGVVKLMHRYNVFGINDTSLEAMSKKTKTVLKTYIKKNPSFSAAQYASVASSAAAADSAV